MKFLHSNPMTAYSKKLIIFDLDGTLAPSKCAIDADMSALITRLIETKKVAIISGGGYPQFQNQVINMLPHGNHNFTNLILMPASGARMYAWKGSWNEQYAEHLSNKEKEKIMIALNTALKHAAYEQPATTYGPLIEDRGSQITFSALGQNAPIAVKATWDPDDAKRRKIISFLEQRIPEFDVRIGGTTSIDITKKGINKGYAIRRLESYLNMSLDEMVFIGDKLFPGDNDYPAKATGIDCIPVTGPEDTKKLIQGWLA